MSAAGTPPSLPTIFLSLSSSDAAFIRKVERNLIHGLAFLYTSAFATGDDMIASMEKHASSSWIFVLFASEASLASEWVRFEIDLARVAKIERPDRRILVFPASPTIRATDLPDWMRRYWFDASGRSAKDVARYINHQLRLGFLRQQMYGRGKLLDQALARYAEHIGSKGISPNVFLFSGLPGIGRTTFARALLERLFPQFSALCMGPVIDISDVEDVANLYRSLREQLQDDFTAEQFQSDREVFDELSDDDKISELVSCLRHFGDLREAVFLKTGRGLFDDLGALRLWVVRLIGSLRDFPTVRLVFLSTRQPASHNTAMIDNILPFHVPPIDDEGISSLLRLEFAYNGTHNFAPSRDVLLAIGGHPMIARNYVAQVLQTGVFLQNHMSMDLIRVQESILGRSLDYENLTQEERNILCLLSWSPFLDGELIAGAFMHYDGTDDRAVSESLYLLVMLCLVDVVTGSYSISRPVRLMFRRKHGFGDDRLLVAFSDALSEYWGQVEGARALRGNLIDTVIFMHALEGKSLPEQFRKLLLPGTLLAVVREAYNAAIASGVAEDLDVVIAFCSLADVMSMEESTRESIMGLKVRAYARRARYAEAQALLEQFEQRGYRSIYSLRGFFHRMRGEFAEAVPWYERALDARIHDLAILHELCICLYRLGRVQEIKQRLENAGERVQENAYLLDMQIQIATAEGRFDEAESLIRVLRRIENDREPSSRREAVLIMRRDSNFGRAIELLDRAIARQSGLALEHRSSRAIANAYLGRVRDARHDIETIRRSKHGRAEAIALRLDAHVSLACNDWLGAVETIKQFKNRTEADSLLEAKALEQKAADVKVTFLERKEARERAIVLRSQHRHSSEYDIT